MVCTYNEKPMTPNIRIIDVIPGFIFHNIIIIAPFIMMYILYREFIDTGNSWYQVIIWLVVSVKIHRTVCSDAMKRYIIDTFFPSDPMNNPFELHGLDRLTEADIKNSVWCVSPHGPTLYPVSACGQAIYKRFGLIVSICAASSMLKIPFVKFISSCIAHVIDVEPKSFIRDVSATTDPVLIYSGGFHDVFENCLHTETLNVMVNSKSRLYDILIEESKTLIPVLVLNEMDNFTHFKPMVRLCRWIHKHYIRCGVPVPVPGSFYVPLFSVKKTWMICGLPIDSSQFKSGQELYHAHIQGIQNLYTEAKTKWPQCTKPLNIVDYSKTLKKTL